METKSVESQSNRGSAEKKPWPRRWARNSFLCGLFGWGFLLLLFLGAILEETLINIENRYGVTNLAEAFFICLFACSFISSVVALMGGLVGLVGIIRKKGAIKGRGKAITGLSLSLLYFAVVFLSLSPPLWPPKLGVDIHGAVRGGYLEGVKSILKKNPELVNARDTEGMTPLHTAAMAVRRSKKVVEFLITEGADLDARDKYGRTPLHLALKMYYIEMAELLITKGADVAVETNSGKSTLHYAVDSHSKKVIEILFAKGLDVNSKTNNGVTPLHIAARWGKKNIIGFLISKGAKISAKNNRGETPLYYAASNDQQKAVEVILGNGADLSSETHEGHTALHYAAGFSGDKKTVELLIVNGSVVNAKSKTGETPLHWVARSGTKEVAELLIASGADVSVKTDDGSTLLHYAASDLIRNSFEHMIERTTSEYPEEGDDLIWPRTWGKRKVVFPLLISKGVEVNDRDKLGNTALHIAAELQRKEIVEILIAKGADVNVKNNEGDTALHMVARCWMKHEMAELSMAYKMAGRDEGSIPKLIKRIGIRYDQTGGVLLANGADVNARNNKGETALHIAAEEGCEEMIELLRKHGGIE